MTCSTVCGATVGAITAATIIGGSYGLIIAPVLVSPRHPADEILNKWMIVTVTAMAVGASFGILATKVARCAYQRITRRQ